MCANSRRAQVCLSVVGLALILLFNLPSAKAVSIKMMTAARESCTRAHNVASAIQQVQRCVFDDNNDFLDKLNRQPVKLTVDGPSETSEFLDVGEAVTTNMHGETEFVTHYVGQTTGSILFGGTNITANNAFLELHDELNMTFESDSANLIQLQFQFSDVSYHETPFVLNLSRLEDGADPLLVSEASVTPADGAFEAALPIPSAGTYRFSIEWLMTDQVLPAGNPTLGIGSYAIHWQMIPEPSAAGMLALGTLASSLVLPRRPSNAAGRSTPSRSAKGMLIRYDNG